MRKRWTHLSDEPPQDASKAGEQFQDGLLTRYLKGKTTRRYTFDPAANEPLKRRDTSDSLADTLHQLEMQILQDPLGNGFSQPLPVIERAWHEFKRDLLRSDRAVSPVFQRTKEWLKSLIRSEQSFYASTQLQLKYAFYDTLVQANSATQRDRQTILKEAMSLDHIQNDYPLARSIRRQIHVHVGPTNSGKTYHALQRLAEAKRGFYASPLRLLAYEVYERMQARGRRTCLLTGDDRRYTGEVEMGGADLFACTVEMSPLNDSFDVGVIDEIQMLGAEDRGWAWTNAFLGAQARELHVCGEARTVPLLEELTALCGDDIHIHRYERLTPLKTGPSFDGDFNRLEKGDCIVAFRVKRLHELRQTVERKTGKRCAIIYGALPPETRAAQAALFNDSDNEYDYLVASNAIGMGLNLKIRRMIFETTARQIEAQRFPLSVADVKQIAGRAGRFSTATEDNSQASNLDTELQPGLSSKAARPGGIVTTLKEMDLSFVELCLDQEPEPIKSAGMQPSVSMIDRFASSLPEPVSFTYMMYQMRAYASHHARLHLCIMDTHLAIADCLESVPNLTLFQKLKFLRAPLDMRKSSDTVLTKAMAKILSDDRSVSIVDMPEFELELLDGPAIATSEYLAQLEVLYRNLVIYSWMGYSFPTTFLDLDLASHTRKLVEERIQQVLVALTLDPERRDLEEIDPSLLDRLSGVDGPLAPPV